LSNLAKFVKFGCRIVKDMKDIWFQRFWEEAGDTLLRKGKVFVLYGPRRVGKTELINKFLGNFDGKIFKGTGDDMDVREILSSQKLSRFKLFFSGYDLVFIDEAQRIPDVGYALKLLVDHFPELIIVVSGSSSFDLSGKLGEPLTGRNILRSLYPLSVIELWQQYGGMHVVHRLEELLIFGAYPEVLKSDAYDEKREYLYAIRDAYLLKDILELENVRNPSKLSDLLKLLAFQIGQEVSLGELSNHLGMAKQSIERYLDLLEKTFVIRRVGGFSRNLRKEITKTSRYYFWDNGVRNAVISNFNLPDIRNDMGMLWENFMVMERLKRNEYQRVFANYYFWRTYDRQEIDLVEERNGQLSGFEFKWIPRKVKPPKAWLDAYPDAGYHVVSRDNFLEFLVEEG
jgi:predicted AAA+ superfamily ATPase